MKKIFIIGLLSALAACGGGGQGVSNGAGQGSGTAANPSQDLMSSSDLLMTGYQDGQVEIQLGQFALQRSANNEVRIFAQRMIDDHTLFNNEITMLAGQRNLILPATPTADQQAAMMQLQGLSGADFDAAYMDFNVSIHDKDVAQFRLQATQAAEADIRLLAAVFYPVLKVHLTRAEEIDGIVNPPAYLISAYLDSLLEIQLGQLALQHATREDVKAYAQRMITDHTALSAQIAQVAQQEGVQLPADLTASRQADLADLARFSGIGFDKAYMDINVTAHAKELAVAQRQSEQGIDPDVKALAQASLPILTQHHQLAVELDDAIRASLP